MLYMKVKRGENYYIHKRGADGQPQGKALYTHEDVALADKQMTALNASLRKEKKKSSKFGSVDFKPTQSMADAAIQGLALSETLPGVFPTHTRSLSEGVRDRSPLDPRAAKKMQDFFNACDASEKGWGDKENPSKKWVLFLMYGGVPGSVWTRAITNQIERANAVKTLNTSEAGSVGFGVADDDRAGEALEKVKARFSLDSSVLHPAMNVKGTVSGVIRLKSGGVIYHVALKSGGLAICTGADLEQDTGEASVKRRDGHIVGKRLYVRVKWMLNKVRGGMTRNLKPAEIRKVLKEAEKASKRKDIPLLARPDWLFVKRYLKQAMVMAMASYRQGAPLNVKELEKKLQQALEHIEMSMRFPMTLGGGFKAEDEEADESVKADVVEAEPPPKDLPGTKAFKSLYAFAQKCTVDFDKPPSPAKLDEALDQAYDLTEEVSQNAHMLTEDDTAIKNIAGAVFSEVGVKDASTWAQHILDAMDALDEIMQKQGA